MHEKREMSECDNEHETSKTLTYIGIACIKIHFTSEHFGKSIIEKTQTNIRIRVHTLAHTLHSYANTCSKAKNLSNAFTYRDALLSISLRVKTFQILRCFQQLPT